MIMQLLQLVVMGDFIYHYIQWYVVILYPYHISSSIRKGISTQFLLAASDHV